MDVTLVVCTRNRAESLRRTLEAVERIESAHAWELVVVENACTDRTPDVVSSFAERTSISVRRAVEPEPGLSRARNTGCRAAQGDIIAFTDDDCYPREDLVDALVSVFRSHDVGFVGGRVLRFSEADADFSVRKGPDPQPLPPHTFPKTGFIIGANMALRIARQGPTRRESVAAYHNVRHRVLPDGLGELSA